MPIVAVVAYAALVGALAAQPPGSDDLWAPLALLVVAHLGLGWAVARPWVLLLPAALCVGLFVVAGASELDWLILFLGLPVTIVVTTVGLLLGLRSEWRSSVAIGLAAIALGCATWTALQWVDRGPHVPASVQRELPTDVSLGNLCPGAESDREFEDDVRRRAEVLIRELRRNPDHVVTDTVYYSHGGDEERDITIRDLAEDQLADIESGGPNCAPELERRIREAL
ncbi:MAG TPA: hypothetical protein VNO82_05340 [Solirubrobacteraceae bacterium]|nr:hypothetical protein [Solirubrobacteraceae bacterium]